jgi:hypothetical protein
LGLLSTRRADQPPEDERLDTPRWRLPLPRRSSLFRWAAVAALLCLAAAVLLTGGGSPERAAPASTPTPVHTRAEIGPPTGTVGFPLRLPDAGVVSIVRAGQRVDVLGGPGPGGVVAEDVLVLRTSEDDDGALLYLGVSRAQANRLAALVSQARLTVTVRTP